MRICIYGASSDQIDTVYMTNAYDFGIALSDRGHSLVFGGGAHGLMGAVARGVSSQNGEILGIAPSFFHIGDILYSDCSNFIYTETMRERKQLMEDNSDAFVMLPGGLGTYEEFFEILTLKQLGRHSKAIVVLNINHYYDTMHTMLRETMDAGFAAQSCAGLFHFSDSIEDVLTYLSLYQPEKIDFEQMKYPQSSK